MVRGALPFRISALDDMLMPTDFDDVYSIPRRPWDEDHDGSWDQGISGNPFRADQLNQVIADYVQDMWVNLIG